jgi:HAE1 family hydrophobic/amphiphilic exporter-1
MIMVSTTYEGAGPQSVEKSVTEVLESALVSLSGLKEISSTSSEGSSMITLEFDYGADLDARTNDIRDKIDTVRGRLPDDADSPRIMRMDPTSMPMIKIAVRGDRTPEEIRELADGTLADKFEQIDGVAQASVYGGRDKIVRVDLSQNRLQAYGLTITGIASKLAAQNLELGGGSISEGQKNYSVRTTGEYARVEDIADTIIATKDGANIRLSDIGTVAMGYEDETSTVYINGESGVYISIRKQSGTNSVQVAEKVYDKLDELRASVPTGITLEIIDDDTDQIRATINEILSSLLQGAVLTMAVLFLFLRTFKSTLIVGISIPFSVLATLLAMHVAGITLNMLTLTGLLLGVGMIVDASIVIIENIFSYRERGAKPTVAAMLGSQEMLAAISSSTLTTVCVFLPIYFFKNKLGMIGQLFQDMTFTVVIALLASLLVAIFLVPVLASTYLVLETRTQKPLKNKALKSLDGGVQKILDRLDAAYGKALAAVMKHRLATVVLVVAAFVGSIAALPNMHVVFSPPMNEDSVTLTVELPLGTKYEETKAVMLQLQEMTRGSIVGAKNIIVNVGSTSGFGSSASATYKGQITVKLDTDNSEADGSEEVKAKLRSFFKDFPNVVFEFSQGRGQQIAGGSEIDIVVRADVLETGLSAAKEIVSIIEEKVPEVTDTTLDMSEGLPQVEVVIDRDRAYSFGLTVAGIANEIDASVDGKTATTFRENGDEYSVVLSLQEADRAKVPDLEKIFVAASDGSLVPLANFASLKKGVGPVSINRENQARIIHVEGGLAEGNRADAVEQKIKEALADNFVAPEGVTVSFEGQWKDIMEQIGLFAMIGAMAIMLVFGVMAGQYESFKDPFINLFTIPLMMIGVVAIYLITGQSLSTFSMVGIVMLAGIVVNNGIVLVDYTNLLVGRGMGVREACAAAGASRLRPVLMTTLTTILGLVPMAFFPGKGATMIQPIGLTVIGGLTSSTLITLFFIPVMYSFLNGKIRKKEAVN